MHGQREVRGLGGGRSDGQNPPKCAWMQKHTGLPYPTPHSQLTGRPINRKPESAPGAAAQRQCQSAAQSSLERETAAQWTSSAQRPLWGSGRANLYREPSPLLHTSLPPGGTQRG